MRRLAMAGDVGGVDPSHTGLLGWLGGLATATIAAAGLWLGQRVLGKAAFQTAINDGFAKLTAELQEERNRLRLALDEERASWAAERLAWAAERATLQGEIRNLMQVIESLKALLRRHGVEVPERQLIDTPEATTLPATPPLDRSTRK